MFIDELIRRTDALEALGEEPAIWSEDDAAQIQERNDWQYAYDAILAVPALPFGLYRLAETDICALHGDCVIVSAPKLPELDKHIVPCLGSHKDMNGDKYVVLDGEEYSQALFADGAITLWQVK